MSNNLNTLRETKAALERAIKVAATSDTLILTTLAEELQEKIAALEVQAEAKFDGPATDEEISPQMSTFTAINLPNQDDGFNWAISQDGKGLVIGVDNRPARYMDKSEADRAIRNMTPVPRPKTIGFANLHDLLPISTGHKLKAALMKKADAVHNIPVYVTSDHWNAAKASI
jgi:hypothetical protein